MLSLLTLYSVIRYGYQVGFLARQELLALFYKHVPEKSKILPGKRVAKVIHSDTGVRVIAKDGEEFAGDIVVGVDGVHSVIRREMWALANELSPGFITDKEKQDSKLRLLKPMILAPSLIKFLS